MRDLVVPKLLGFSIGPCRDHRGLSLDSMERRIILV